WYDPSPPGAAYGSVFFRAAGVILGNDVEGFVVFEQRHLPSGQLWSDGPYTSGWAGAPPLQSAWAVFATEWDDGATEFGHLCAGGQSWGFAMIAEPAGPVLLSTTVELESDGASTIVRFGTGGDWWEWVRDVELEAVRPFEIELAAEGAVRRVGD